jgi:glucokinase-like ROK family protein
MIPLAAMPTEARAASARARRELVVGVDVGGSKIAAIAVDPSDRVVGREWRPIVTGRPERAGDDLAEVVTAVLHEAGADDRDLAAVGVGVPGRVDPRTGAVSLAVNLGWQDVRLGSILEARLGVPVVVENDVRAAALGLLRRGALGPVRDFAYLAVGTGISAGVVVDGALRRGPRGLAGEIGHIVVEPGGERCSCGGCGCLETVASGPAIARRATERVAAGEPSSLAAARPDAEPPRRGGPIPITAADVYGAAAEGDPLAREIAEAAGSRLAWAVALLVLTLDLERVVIGGGVAAAGEPFLDPIRSGLDALRADAPQASELIGRVDVMVAADGSDPGPWGAVTVAREARAAPVPAGREEVGHG